MPEFPNWISQVVSLIYYWLVLHLSFVSKEIAVWQKETKKRCSAVICNFSCRRADWIFLWIFVWAVRKKNNTRAEGKKTCGKKIIRGSVRHFFFYNKQEVSGVQWCAVVCALQLCNFN